MSFNASMLRGLALYAVFAMAEHSMGNTKVLSDLVNEAQKTAR